MFSVSISQQFSFKELSARVVKKISLHKCTDTHVNRNKYVLKCLAIHIAMRIPMHSLSAMLVPSPVTYSYMVAGKQSSHLSKTQFGCLNSAQLLPACYYLVCSAKKAMQPTQ